jgi:hypothetical protein
MRMTIAVEVAAPTGAGKADSAGRQRALERRSLATWAYRLAPLFLLLRRAAAGVRAKPGAAGALTATGSPAATGVHVVRGTATSAEAGAPPGPFGIGALRGAATGSGGSWR